MCTKRNKITMRDVGVIAEERCLKPEFKDGLCAYHYRRSIEKQTPWGHRKDYIAATQEDLNTGTSLKLKNSNSHQLFKVKNGVVIKFNTKTDRYDIITEILPHFDLFCVKKPF
jgi:hypothetical protein